MHDGGEAYNIKMRKSNFNYNNQYYNSGRSRYSSASSRRQPSEYSGRSVSSSRNRFYHRIEKACTTFSSKDLGKEVTLFRKEIEKLERDGLKKDKTIFELKQFNMHNKEIETELVEVYRVLYMYEGKIKEYENQLKKMEKAIASQVPHDITAQVEELLESYRMENSDLSAQLEERNKMLMDLEVKGKKMENKYFSTAWKLSSTKREISNPLKKRFPNLRNTIAMNEPPLLEKEKTFKRSQARLKTNDFPGQYQITNDLSFKEKAVNFRKVQASIPKESKPASSNSIGMSSPYKGGLDTVNEPFTFLGNSASPSPNEASKRLVTLTPHAIVPALGSYVPASSSYLPSSSKVPASTSNVPASSSYVPSSTYVAASYQSMTPQQASNTNIHSQMTISNAGTARKIEYREARSLSPRADIGTSPASRQNYAFAKDLNDVNNMVKNVEKRMVYVPTKSTTVTGQSIYLN